MQFFFFEMNIVCVSKFFPNLHDVLTSIGLNSYIYYASFGDLDWILKSHGCQKGKLIFS